MSVEQRVGHTAGPWEANQGFDDEDDRWVVGPSGPEGLGNWVVAMIHNGAPGDTMQTEEANANLIAAAPDLLAACEAIAAHATTDDDGNHVCWVGESTLQLAVAAVRKAKGEVSHA